MVGDISVTGTYLSMALLTLIGIGMPLGAFVTQYFVMPKTDPSRPNITRSWLMEGYESDHSLYPRRLSTYECGSEPVGDAMIQFHFQYYWYAIIFLVFDVAFMFLALGGLLAAENTGVGASAADLSSLEGSMLVLATFFGIMVMGVWHVFRKRGRIYI
ncbi:MAG: NADH-quinone oxidoreductase subunit A [Candidatus Poseidoniaceae archaeon]|jgi:NADH:ubiquinone oxidoreductase subunit 3 (subunit A)|nr:NADH-quinone oxidoreductase subunit A [Candidatus Poseidoniaceae archaeon]